MHTPDALNSIPVPTIQIGSTGEAAVTALAFYGGMAVMSDTIHVVRKIRATRKLKKALKAHAPRRSMA